MLVTERLRNRTRVIGNTTLRQFTLSCGKSLFSVSSLVNLLTLVHVLIITYLLEEDVLMTLVHAFIYLMNSNYLREGKNMYKPVVLNTTL